MITIDGARGEGGGQMLRSALSLSLVTGQPFTLENARAGREQPGLRPQHVAAVDAAATIGSADVEGAHVGSRRVVFRPGPVRGGCYQFDVGTAGSATLVAQTVLAPLLTADTPSVITLAGGTHNPLAPPFEFLAGVFLPLVERMGPRVSATLASRGFYPRGGGRFTVDVTPAPRLRPLVLTERGEVRRRRARALVVRLPARIAQRELAVVDRRLGWQRDELETVTVERSPSPGNALLLTIESAHVTELFSAIGARGVPAERVAEEAVAAASDYLAAGVPVGPHLADQLLLPMALAGGGAFVTGALSRHTTTNLEVIRAFLAVEVRTSPLAGGAAVELRCGS